MTFYIVPIVEGQTEAGCIECLLQRLWAELLAAPLRLQVLAPSRGKRDALIHPERPDLARKVEEAHAKLAPRLRRDPSGRGLLLLLLDAEGDCPKELAPRLLATARQVRGDADISCVLAKRMLENWIVAGASTLAGVNGLPDPLPPRDQFEDRGGAAWLEAQLRSRNKARKYKKTADAEAFVRVMALQECRDNSPSFDKLCRELEARLPRQPDTTGPREGAAPPTPEEGASP
jgi:hypothetical protein